MRGDLSETTAAGACRSLATREASGALLIDATDGTGLIRFREGRIVGVASPTPGARIGDRLVGAGILPRSALDEVLADQRSGRETRPLHRALVERELVSEEAVDRVLRDRMLDAMLELTHLDTGTQLFLSEEELHAEGSPDDDEVAGPTLEVDDAFRAVDQRREDLLEVQRRIPDPTVVPTSTALARETLRGAAADADATTILEHIDGIHSIGEIAVTVGYGALEVTRIIEGLMSAGLVDLERPRDAVGDELDDAIRQLSGQVAPSDTSAPDGSASQSDYESGDEVGDGADDVATDVAAATATTDLHGPLIEAELPEAATDPDTSWDDLFGGGDPAGAPGGRTRETAVSPAEGPQGVEPTSPAPERSDAHRSDRDAAGAPATGSAREEPHERSRPAADPPPFFADTRRPETPGDGPDSGATDEPAAPEPRDDRRSTDEDTDVSEFLRELSRLALGEDAPRTPRRSSVEPPAPGETPHPGAGQGEDRVRRPQSQADTDHARRRRGFFGRG